MSGFGENNNYLETEGSGIQVSGSYIEALPDYKVNNDTTFLPDGIGECYSTSIDLDMFADGATVTSIDDIDRIYINMEHSYLGDISMMIRCPNGQTCLLKAHSNSSTSAITMPSLNWTNSGGINNSGSIGGGTTHLGLSPDPSDSTSFCYYTIGEGYSYNFTPQSTAPFGQSGPTNPITYTDPCGNTESIRVLNEGDYGTYESMSSLIGCPLNGTWTIYVCDHMTQDNGYIFEWGLFFREDLYPATWGYDVYAVSTLVESNSLGVSDYSDASGAGIMIAPPANFSGNNQHVNIQVVDNFGCISSSPIEVDFDVPEPLTVSVLSNDPLCLGNSTMITSSVAGGTTPYSYAWSNGETAAVVSVAAEGAYSLTVTDANNCTSASSVNITGYEIVASIAMSSDEFSDGIYYYNACAGGSVEMNGIIQSGTVDSWRWYINPHNGNSSVFTTQNVTYTPTDALAHDITLTAMDEHGCPIVAHGRIRVSGGLETSVTDYALGEICVGNSREITIGGAGSDIQANSESHTIEAYLGYEETIFIPDGPNCTEQCYESSVIIDDFDEGATITSVDDINYVKMNMEHSFIGDLQLKITCPNGQSAIMLQDYYSSDSGRDLFSSNAIDPYTYTWPAMIMTTRWRVGTTTTSWYTGLYMLGRDGVYENPNEAYLNTNDGYNYYLASFESAADANDFINNYLSHYYSGRDYTVYNITHTSTNTYLYSVIGYTTSDDEGDHTYIVWLSIDETMAANAFSFPTQEAAQYFLTNVCGGNGVVSSYTYTEQGHYHRVYLGEPDIYDCASGANLNVSQICDADDEHNIYGVGYDYAWTNNSQYTTVGYVYDLVNLSSPSASYNNGVDSTSSFYHVLPSNIETGTQMYQPFQSFSNLIGCPLNGTWTISVCDSWAQDNGYVFDWEIALSEDFSASNWDYTVDLDGVSNDCGSIATVSGNNLIVAPQTSSNGEQICNIILSDNLGCTTNIPLTYTAVAPTITHVSGDEAQTVCEGQPITDIIYTLGGVAVSATVTGLPDGVTMIVSENTVTISGTPTTYNTYSYTIATVSQTGLGCVEQTVTGSINVSPLLTINFTSVDTPNCNGDEVILEPTVENGNSPYNYAWGSGAITESITVMPTVSTTYTLTVIDNNGCTASAFKEISVPESLTSYISVTTDISCYGGTTDITNMVSGGTEGYVYTWSNGATSQNLEGVGAGTYSVTVTDSNDCTASASVTISQPTEFSVSLSAETIQYNGGTTDIINTVAGGAMPYTYAWSNGETSQNLESVVAGTYSVTVTDNNGCIVSESVFLTEPELFTIVVSSSDDAMGTVSGGGTYDEGTEIAISATSAVHCHFVQWNDGNTDNPRTIVVIEDATYTAEFAFDQYTITILSANGAMGTVSESGTYDYGTEIEISAIPSEHHHFVSWSDGNTENPRIVTVTEDVMYIATFAIDQFAITVTANDYTMGTVSGGGIYNYGSERQIYASPYAHYRFVQWSDGNTDNPRTINVTADATYTAEFEIGQITITVSSSNEEMGTVSGSGSYDYGAEIQISAIATEHHHFVQWNDGNTENPRAITVTEDATFIAEFAIDQFTVSVVSENETMGTVSGGGTYDYSSTILISATPVEHYHFVQWNDGNTENPRTVIVTENVTYTASFAIGQITVTATSADETMGTVYGGGSYGYGAEIQITATATEHYHFVQWSDGSTENPRMVIVTEDATYIATFAIDWYTINVLANNSLMGTVTGSGTYEYNTEIQISASAIEHHHFVQWNDGNTDNPRTISVTDDATYTAEFAIDQFVVAVVSANDMMGFVSGNGSYDYGSEIQITAEANEHYHFVSWNDGSTENPRNITVTENVTYTAEFAIDQFTIAVVSENNAMGTVSEGGTYDYGTEIQIYAMPYEHYHFVQWNDGNTDNPRTIVATENATYTATFAIDQYEITVSSADEEMGTVYGSGIYNYGSVAIIMALANDGYEFVSWNDENTDNPRQIMVTEEATFIATFDQEIVPVIYYTFSETACGRYIWNGQTYSESGEYYQTFTTANSTDSIVRLDLVILPVPEPEITVDGILDACNPETASVTLSTGEYTSYIWSNGETTSSIVVTTPDVYYVEVVDSIGCHGVSEMATVGYSSVITEAPWIKRVGMSNSGTNIISWGVTSNTGITGFEVYRENTEADVYTCIARIDRPGARLYNDITSEPSARAYRYKICAVDECGGRSPMSDFHKTMHLTINRGLGTTWNLIWSHYEGLEFSTYRIYAGTEPNSMSMVVGEIPSNLNSFTDINNTLEEGMYYRVEVVMNRVTKDDEISLSSNIVANEFVERYSVVALSNNANFGTVYGGGTYPALLNTTLYAEPNDGYEFVSWSDGNTDNPRVINVTGDAIYVATFAESAPAPVETYTITAVSANPEYGTVTGGGSYSAGTVITLNAEANDGYRFVQWSDGNTDNPREITVMENAVYVAYFTENPPAPAYTITAVSANPEHGSVTGGGTYPEGAVISIEAIANEGYEFISWNDNIIDNPREITVTGDAMYIATFVPVTDIAENAVPEISVYPNPVEDILNITSSVEITEIEIVNVMGQIVLRKDVNSDSTVCNVAGLPSGVYMVRIYSRPFAPSANAQGTAVLRKFVKE